ncbi:MAG: prolyl oligopeptidase family serine peptidase [Acidobacteria bacterium]|nr:prolyl oligopeptidase family serine peptidase [Acidobacteriota bacterium]
MKTLTHRTLSFSSIVLLTVLLTFALGATAAAQSHLTGTLPDGATYVIDVPANWNGTLLLYSHGYVFPGGANPAQDVGDGITATYVFGAGYALAGSSYASTDWAVKEAIPDQIAVLDAFKTRVGTPTTTIAWGHSMGGMISAALVQQFPTRFNGALPMCGIVAGAVGQWNQWLDGAFVFNTLLAGGTLQLVHITNPNNFANAETILGAAQGTPQGRARLALAAAFTDTPGWADPSLPEPAPTDYTTRQVNQFLWLANGEFPLMFAFRAELEARAGGNPSWNTGVNYATLLKKSNSLAEVQALYAAAGLSLDADLATLKGAKRISADAAAKTYLTQNVTYNGQITVPVLTLHTTADGGVNVENEKAYSTTVHTAGNTLLLKETFVHRAGHCEFTPAETIAALQKLATRVTTGKWKAITPASMNSAATALGPGYNVLFLNNQLVPVAPEFEKFTPLNFLRPFDAFSN